MLLLSDVAGRRVIAIYCAHSVSCTSQPIKSIFEIGDLRGAERIVGGNDDDRVGEVLMLFFSEVLGHSSQDAVPVLALAGLTDVDEVVPGG